MAPRRASPYASRPDVKASSPTAASNQRMNGLTCDAVSLGLSPRRAAMATITPSGGPTHQVATTPHPSANTVGEVVCISEG